MLNHIQSKRCKVNDGKSEVYIAVTSNGEENGLRAGVVESAGVFGNEINAAPGKLIKGIRFSLCVVQSAVCEGRRAQRKDKLRLYKLWDVFPE